MTNMSHVFGDTLKALIKSHGYTQKRIAEITNIVPSHLSEVIKGKKPFTLQFAAKMSDIFSYEELEPLIKLQIEIERNSLNAPNYSDASLKVEQTLKDYDNIISLKTLCNRLEIKEKDNTRKLDILQSEYNIPTPAELTAVSGHYFRKSTVSGLDTRMILTWTLIAKHEVRKQNPTGVYDREKIPALKGRLKTILNENKNTLKRLKETFSEFGIRFCIVEKVPQASIEGFSFLEDGMPSIVLTLRYNRIDNLAFNVLHELGHVFLHLGNNTPENISIEKYDALSEKEVEADTFANNVLIPPDIMQDMPIVPLNNVYAIQQIYSNWARRHGINKWIVLGRVSHETGIYNYRKDATRDIN